ncbi:MAG: VOC family protein [Sandaracinaceae bacterium]|nr:VOC family protein [Sandaracinaceae bacterium]
MLDHLSLGVADLERAAALYDAALAALGHVRLATSPRAVCYGPPGFTGEAPFAILLRTRDTPPGGADRSAPGEGFHLAFRASSRAGVDAFHAAALAHGGSDEGPPGIRAHYGPHYYAAFVRDVDGHRLEAVCHESVTP